MARILLIEDDTQIRELLRETLMHEGHEVIECENGAEGVRHYQQSNIDLVIMDVLLPDKDGIETLSELKQYNAHVNVLAISGGFSQGTVNVLDIQKRLGAKETLAKPFDLKFFLKVVNQLLAVQETSP